MGGFISFYKKDISLILLSVVLIVVGIVLLALEISYWWGGLLVVGGVGFPFLVYALVDPVLCICSPIVNTQPIPKIYSYKLYEKKEYMKIGTNQAGNEAKWTEVRKFMSKYDDATIGYGDYKAAMELLCTTNSEYVIGIKSDKVDDFCKGCLVFNTKDNLSKYYNNIDPTINNINIQIFSNTPILQINNNNSMFIIENVKNTNTTIPHSYRIYTITDEIISNYKSYIDMLIKIKKRDTTIPVTKTIIPK
jgi:hypothetical protein